MHVQPWVSSPSFTPSKSVDVIALVALGCECQAHVPHFTGKREQSGVSGLCERFLFWVEHIRLLFPFVIGLPDLMGETVTGGSI